MMSITTIISISVKARAPLAQLSVLGSRLSGGPTARLRGIMSKIVKGVVETRSSKLRLWRGYPLSVIRLRAGAGGRRCAAVIRHASGSESTTARRGESVLDGSRLSGIENRGFRRHGSGSSKRHAFGLSVIRSRLSGGQRGAEIPDQWP